MAQTQRIIRRGRRVRPVISAANPMALALCDGCRFLVNRNQLRMQMDYRGGATPVPTGFLHCPRCYDQPQHYYQKQVLPPDPVPVVQPRPDDNGGELPWSQSDTPWVWLTTQWNEWDTL